MKSVANTLETAQMEWIVEQIKGGKCVPFLGAAANVSRVSPPYQGLPLGFHLARQLFSKLGYEKEKHGEIDKLRQEVGLQMMVIDQKLAELYPNEDLSQLSDQAKLERLLASHGLWHSREFNLARLALEYDDLVSRPALNKFLASEIPDEDRQPSPLLNTLARLPISLIITTNYDRLMEKALEANGKVRDVDFKVIIQENSEGFSQHADDEASDFLIDGPPDLNKLIIYKIHGSFSPDLPGLQKGKSQPARQKLIITEDDYIEFLSIINDPYKGIPHFITEYLASATLLFFGYSLEDWDFRVIYKSLIESLEDYQREKSYAFQRNPHPKWAKYWSDRHIEIIDMDHYLFAEQLGQYFPENSHGQEPIAGEGKK